MKHKPYSPKWTRKRYLAEALQKYFDDGESVNVILDDIVDILEDNATEYRSRAEKFQDVLNGLKSFSY
jgi:hypothetical protein